MGGYSNRYKPVTKVSGKLLNELWSYYSKNGKLNFLMNKTPQLGNVRSNIYKYRKGAHVNSKPKNGV